MLKEDKNSININDIGDHIVIPGYRFKLMSYNWAKSLYIWRIKVTMAQHGLL